jgi:hypothetical protein
MAAGGDVEQKRLACYFSWIRVETERDGPIDVGQSARSSDLAERLLREIVVLGQAGSGKTTTIQRILDLLRLFAARDPENTDWYSAVLSASSAKGGQNLDAAASTFHALMRLKVDRSTIGEFGLNDIHAELLMRAGVIVLDEMGMLGALTLIRGIATVQHLRTSQMNIPSGLQFRVPGWGGAVAIIAGDPQQLPAVEKETIDGSVAHGQIQRCDLSGAVSTKLGRNRRETDEYMLRVLAQLAKWEGPLGGEVLACFQRMLQPMENIPTREAFASEQAFASARVQAVAAERDRQLREAAAVLAVDPDARLIACTHETLYRVEELIVEYRRANNLDIGVEVHSCFFARTKYVDSHVCFGEFRGFSHLVLYGDWANDRQILAFMNQFKHHHGDFNPRIPLKIRIWKGRKLVVKENIDPDRGLVNGAEVEAADFGFVQGTEPPELVAVEVKSEAIERYNRMKTGFAGRDRHAVFPRKVDKAVVGTDELTRAMMALNGAEFGTVHNFQGSSLAGILFLVMEESIFAALLYTMLTRSRDSANKVRIIGVEKLSDVTVVRDAKLDRNRDQLDEHCEYRHDCMPDCFPANAKALEADALLRGAQIGVEVPYRVWFPEAPYFTEADRLAVVAWVDAPTDEIEGTPVGGLIARVKQSINLHFEPLEFLDRIVAAQMLMLRLESRRREPILRQRPPSVLGITIWPKECPASWELPSDWKSLLREIFVYIYHPVDNELACNLAALPSETFAGGVETLPVLTALREWFPRSPPAIARFPLDFITGDGNARFVACVGEWNDGKPALVRPFGTLTAVLAKNRVDGEYIIYIRRPDMLSGLVDRGVARHVERVPLGEVAFQLDKREVAECCVYDTHWVDVISEWPVRLRSKRDKRRAEIAGDDESEDEEGELDAPGGEIDESESDGEYIERPPETPSPPPQRAERPPIRDFELPPRAVVAVPRLNGMTNPGTLCADIVVLHVPASIVPVRDLADFCALGNAGRGGWQDRFARLGRIFEWMFAGPFNLRYPHIEALAVRGRNDPVPLRQQDVWEVFCAYLDSVLTSTDLGEVFLCPFTTLAQVPDHPLLCVHIRKRAMTMSGAVRAIALGGRAIRLPHIIAVEVNRRTEGEGNERGHTVTSRAAFTFDMLRIDVGQILALDGESDTFQLFAVVFHVGGDGDLGHYCVALRLSGRWFHCDTETITPFPDQNEFVTRLRETARNVAGFFLVREAVADTIISR